VTAPAGSSSGSESPCDDARGPTRLFLVRHPRPDVPEGLCYGASDVPIDAAHLTELLDALPRRLPAAADLYSSPLSRCLRLARGLRDAGFGEPTVDPRLREMDFGRWEGRRWGDLPRVEIDAWRDDLERYVPPGGEPLTALAERAGAFVRALPSGRDAVVVTHAGVIQTLLRTLWGRPLSEFGGSRIDYGQVVRIERRDLGWVRLD
jgi:alpha-ribazole phosphatase